MGGFIATLFAARYPERVDRLVISGAIAKCDHMARAQFEVWKAIARAYGTDSDELAIELCTKALSRQFLDESFGAAELQAIREVVARNVEPDVFCDACDAMIDTDVTAELGRISSPTAASLRRRGLPDAARLRARRRRDAAHGRAHPRRAAARLRRAAGTATSSSARTSRSRSIVDFLGGVVVILREAFDYEFSRLDPTGPHIDPATSPSTSCSMVKGADWPALPASRRVLGGVRRTASSGGAAPRRRSFPLGRPCDAHAVARPARAPSLRVSVGPALVLGSGRHVEVEDERTLVFMLHYPYVRLPSLLWGTHTTIYNEALREASRIGSASSSRTARARSGSCRGRPSGSSAERFDGYDGPSAKLDGIEWLAILGPARPAGRRSSGAMSTSFTARRWSEVHRLRDDHDSWSSSIRSPRRLPRARLAPLATSSFDDLRVRQAISLASIGEAIVREVYLGPRRRPSGDRYRRATCSTTPTSIVRRTARSRAGRRAASRGPRRASRSVASALCRTMPPSIGPLRRLQAAARGDRRPARAPVREAVRALLRGVRGRPVPASSTSGSGRTPLDAVIGFASTPLRRLPELAARVHSGARRGIRELAPRRDRRDELRAAASTAQRIAADAASVRSARHADDVWVHTTPAAGLRALPGRSLPALRSGRAPEADAAPRGCTPGASQLRIEDVPVPEPTGDAVLVRVAGAGVCRSDLHVLDGMFEELVRRSRDDGPRDRRTRRGARAVGRRSSRSASPSPSWSAGAAVSAAGASPGHEQLCAEGRRGRLDRRRRLRRVRARPAPASSRPARRPRSSRRRRSAAPPSPPTRP